MNENVVCLFALFLGRKWDELEAGSNRVVEVMKSKSEEQEWRSGDAGWSTRDARSGSVTHH